MYLWEPCWLELLFEERQFRSLEGLRDTAKMVEERVRGGAFYIENRPSYHLVWRWMVLGKSYVASDHLHPVSTILRPFTATPPAQAHVGAECTC